MGAVCARSNKAIGVADSINDVSNLNESHHYSPAKQSSPSKSESPKKYSFLKQTISPKKESPNKRSITLYNPNIIKKSRDALFKATSDSNLERYYDDDYLVGLVFLTNSTELLDDLEIENIYDIEFTQPFKSDDHAKKYLDVFLKSKWITKLGLGGNLTLVTWKKIFAWCNKNNMTSLKLILENDELLKTLEALKDCVVNLNALENLHLILRPGTVDQNILKKSDSLIRDILHLRPSLTSFALETPSENFDQIQRSLEEINILLM